MTWRNSVRRYIPLNLNWWGFALAFFISGLTFFGDKRAFLPAGKYSESPLYVLAKFCGLLFIVVMVQLCIYLIRNYRQGNRIVKRFCLYFSLGFAVMLLFWLLTYPGITTTDEANVLYAARHLDLHMSWYHVLTNFCYVFSLGLFPSWGSITFLEILFVCLITAYITTQVSVYFGSRKTWWLFIFFLSPQVLADSLTPHRISFFASAELLLIFLVWRYSYTQANESKSALIIISILTGIVATWRSEAVIYLVSVPLCLWLFERHRNDRVKRTAMVVSISFAVFLPITVVQNLNADLTRQYQVTGLIAPLSSILHGGNYIDSNKQYTRQVVDKAINYDQLVAGEDANEVYWSRSDRSISSTDLSSLQKLTVHLIISNPSPYLKSAVVNYANSGMNSIRDPSELIPRIDLRFSEGLLASHPYDESIRDKAISLLKGDDLSGEHVTWVYRIFYANPCVGVMLVFITMLLVLKRKVIAVLFLAVIAKNCIVVLTMPMPSVYYFYPLTLVGGMLIILAALQFGT